MQQQQRKRRSVSRRSFMAGAAAVGTAVVPRFVLGGAASAPPSDRLLVGLIGAGGRGKNLVQAMTRFPDVEFIAVCDPNDESDYSAFYYRGTSGRVPIAKLLRDHYAGQHSGGGYAGPAEHLDFRKMLEKEKDLDAVVVATPDHVHAVVCMAAMKLGKHVYCEKPLTHSIHEARALAETAHQAKVATQMGNQGHAGEGIRQICEWIWACAIGAVSEVASWSDTGYWTTFTGRPPDAPPVPAAMRDWDLWIGPAPFRPYHPAYTPYNWRGWWDFGTGAIGDMACHNMDPAFWALKLVHPETVEASSTRINEETTSNGNIIRYTFAARGDNPPVKLTWYDGGLRPPRPDELEPGERLDGNGILFYGEKGKILCGGWSNGPRLIPRSRMQEYRQPEQKIPRTPGIERDWVDGCKSGRQPCSSFPVAGPMVEAILLGNVATRTQSKLWWDGPAMKVTNNVPEAERFIKPPYRSGWSL